MSAPTGSPGAVPGAPSRLKANDLRAKCWVLWLDLLQHGELATCCQCPPPCGWHRTAMVAVPSSWVRPPRPAAPAGAYLGGPQDALHQGGHAAHLPQHLLAVDVGPPGQVAQDAGHHLGGRGAGTVGRCALSPTRGGLQTGGDGHRLWARGLPRRGLGLGDTPPTPARLSPPPPPHHLPSSCTWCSSSLSEASWATMASMQPRRAHSVACGATGESHHGGQGRGHEGDAPPASSLPEHLLCGGAGASAPPSSPP